jgi:uncharacterized protein (DUF2252 family)
MKSALVHNFRSVRPSIEERIAAGKKLREKYPRSKQGDYAPAANRADPVSILEKQAQTRLQELVPIRYARMLTSPFSFFRGAAAIMAADLATSQTTGITAQICGDMHVANFGIFASEERNLIFGINDFDETLPGPWEWDLKRLVTSIVTSSRFLGADEHLCKKSVMAAVRSYRKRIKEYAYMGNMELHYTTIDEEHVLKAMPAQQKEIKKLMNHARTQTQMQVLGKITDIVDDKYRLRDDAPLIVHETHTEKGRPILEAIGLWLESYFPSLADDRKALLSHYYIVDVARKVVGVGSVGTRCWIVFLAGNHTHDPLFLQVKEAEKSVLEPLVTKTVYKNQGQRVVAGQRLLQGAPDIFLGWGEQDGIDYYVRQLRDMKGGVEFEPSKWDIKEIPAYGELCGWALALAHAKSGDAAMISGYAGNSNELDKAMVNFAFAYANQTEKDYKTLVEAKKSGRIKVASEEK